MAKQRVLFLCTGNSARSQMAEAFLRFYAGDRFEVHSAGLDPKGIHPKTIEAMAAIDIDISEQRSSSVKEYLAQSLFAYIITVCAHAEENCPRVFLNQAKNHLHWNFEDPAAFEGSEEATFSKFAEVRDQIQDRIRNWLVELDEDAARNATESTAHPQPD